MPIRRPSPSKGGRTPRVLDDPGCCLEMRSRLLWFFRERPCKIVAHPHQAPSIGKSVLQLATSFMEPALCTAKRELIRLVELDSITISRGASVASWGKGAAMAVKAIS